MLKVGHAILKPKICYLSLLKYDTVVIANINILPESHISLFDGLTVFKRTQVIAIAVVSQTILNFSRTLATTVSQGPAL